MEDVRPVYSSNGDTSVMSVKDWVITLLITAIPLVGFIMLFIWALAPIQTLINGIGQRAL